MKPPEITPAARLEIAAAVAVLMRHGVEKFSASNGPYKMWVISPAFSPFLLRGAEIAAADQSAGKADYEAWANDELPSGE